MTYLLHSANLWAAIVLIGVFGLLGDTAWRSWHLPGQPLTAGPVFAVRPVPVVTGDGHTLWSAGVQVEYTPTHAAAAPFLPDVAVSPVHAGATEEWSPIGEVAAAGRSDEDWWSERLQQYDNALHWIDTVPRCAELDGAGAFAVVGRTVDEELAAFIDGSQRLHAYRELRIGGTGEFSPRDHMQLEQLLSA